MPNRLVSITPPTVEPLSLTDAKAHLRVDFSDDDDLINVLIQAAREWAEDFCHRAFITQTWQLILDHFPGAGLQGQGYVDPVVLGDSALGLGAPPVGYTYRHQTEIFFRAGTISVPKPPLQSVDSITYRDINGDLQTLVAGTANDYVVDTASEPARIAPAPNKTWPLTQISIRAPVLDAVTVEFTCGFGETAAAVPASIRAAMKLFIGHWYGNREEVITGLRAAAVQVPTGGEALLWRNKVVAF